MTNKKGTMNKEKEEFSEEKKRKKALKKMKKENEEKSIFEEMLDEVLEDPQIYDLLKKLKD